VFIWLKDMGSEGGSPIKDIGIPKLTLELEYKDLAKARYKKTFAVQLGVVMIGTVKEPGERAFVGALEFSEVG
jgi:hypothetical protein